MRPIKDTDLNDSSVVGYSSINRTTGTSFTAVTDPNNPHAARLARLAVAVQNKEQEASQNRLRLEAASRVSSWLPWYGSAGSSSRQTRPQLGYQHASLPITTTPTTASLPPPATYSPAEPQYRGASTYSADDTASGYYPSAYASQTQVAYAPRAYAQSHTSSTVSPPAMSADVAEARVVTVAPPVGYSSMPLEVTRYRTETKTAYKVEGLGQWTTTTAKGERKLEKPKREMYVSAPVGSNEATLFDYIADGNSYQNRG
ncbi:hypothetical protein OQA88_8309 [Cercophora sp. LCS_1]